MERGAHEVSRLGRDGPGDPVPAEEDHTPRALGVTVLKAASSDEAEDVVGRIYLPNQVRTLERGPVGMSLTALRVGRTTVGQLEYGRHVRLLTDEATHVHVNTPLTGTVVSRTGRSELLTTTNRSAAVFAPGAPAQIEWSTDAAQLCVMVPQATLQNELEELMGQACKQPLRLPFHMSLSTPQGRVWRSMMNLIAGELSAKGPLLTHLAAGRQVERTLIDTLLLGHAHNHAEELNRPAAPALPNTIARAVDLLHEHPEEPWSSTTLARAVHVSLRSLQSGFARHLGRPPMAYLRELRLARIREDLELATAGTTTVESVAYSWGMLHMGRFAAAYREAFGELPSQTLKQPPG
ncbi:AraC family transcriptional regulator [Pedococcus sp. KACC 23699]|uniref:AraC family transcriptional regulator n=1 Tax=Pedococcus sp. KACC 23699 TaxID=3149228 RepID=A0AAU7JRP5_9MICO